MDQFKNHLNQAVWNEINKKKKTGRAGAEPKFLIFFRLGQARAEISISLSGQAGLGSKF